MPEQDTRENLRKLIVYVRPYVGGLVVALLLTVFLTAIQMMPPIVVMLIIDNVIIEGNWGLLWVLLLISLMIPIIASGLRVWNTYLMSYISFKLIMDIRLDLYRHLLALPMAFHEEIGTGKVMSRIMSDVVTVRTMVTRRLLEMVTDLVTFLTAVSLCLGLNLKLGLLMFLLMPLYFLNYKIFIGGMKSAWRTWRKKMDQVSVGLQERLGGVQLVKSYGRERRENRSSAR